MAAAGLRADEGFSDFLDRIDVIDGGVERARHEAGAEVSVDFFDFGGGAFGEEAAEHEAGVGDASENQIAAGDDRVAAGHAAIGADRAAFADAGGDAGGGVA